MAKFQELGIEALKPKGVSKKLRPLGLLDVRRKNKDFLLAGLPPSVVPAKPMALTDSTPVPYDGMNDYEFDYQNGRITSKIRRIFTKMQALVRDEGGEDAYVRDLTGARLQKFEELDRQLWELDEKRKELWTKRQYFKEGDPPAEALNVRHHEFGKCMLDLGYCRK